MRKSVVDGFFTSAKKHPEKTAIIWKKEKITYSELEKQVKRVAQFLVDHGVKEGDRVVFYGKKHPLFVYCYLAIHSLKAVAVPLDVKLPEERFHEIIDLIEPSVIIHPTRNKKSITQVDFTDASFENELLEIFDFPEAIDLADILFTTGTTGSSKGVMLSHQNILAGAVNSNQFIGNTSEDVEIIPLPLHHAFGLRRLRTNLMLGATVVLVDGFLFPKIFFNAIEEFGANGICLVPAGFEVIKKLMKDRYIEPFQKLKYIEFGSSPMSMTLKKELIQNLPNTRICMHYGLTEVAANIFIEFHESAEKLDGLGTASPNVEVGILGENTTINSTDEVGEIIVRGDIRSMGYWRNDPLTQQSYYQDWFRTGDLGYIDTEGYVFMSGRVDDVMNIGGKKVFPSEIENILEQHPLVQSCACISEKVNGSITGEEIIAFLVTDSGQELNESQIIQFLTGKLESYKIPTHFRFIDKIPLTASGKKQREHLKSY